MNYEITGKLPCRYNKKMSESIYLIIEAKTKDKALEKFYKTFPSAADINIIEHRIDKVIIGKLGKIL